MSSRLLLETPATRTAERRYVARVLFEELLGLACEVRVGERACSVLTLPGAGGEITIADGFLGMPESEWLSARSVPSAATQWAVPDGLGSGGANDSLWVLSAEARDGGRCTLGADLFGTAFFLLTRYEEVARPSLDAHGRQVPGATLAGKGGWLDRPMVNEIAEVFRQAIAREWPSVHRPLREFRLLVSHDVDHPYCVAGRSAWHLAGGAARALVREGWNAGARRIAEWRQVSRDGAGADPCWTFDWLMAESERRGLRSAFYFIPETGPQAEYRVGDEAIESLIGRIAARGHEVGFHPSYAAAEQAELFLAEFQRMQASCLKAGASAGVGGRHHYLRWRADGSWAQWDGTGLRYDSSVGYASQPGFRAGICAEYSTFDLRGRRPLALKERPLMVMDVSLLGAHYLGLSHRDAVTHALGLARTCRHYRGDFVLLWHNDRLRTPEDREAYLAILDGCR